MIPITRLLLCCSLIALVGARAGRADPPPSAPSPSAPSPSPSTPWGEDLVVMLVTFGPGDDVTSWFGHSALVVEDRRTHDARLYNYGEFSFDDTMLVRYALGRLEFWVGERPVEPSLEIYRRQRRSIQVQELALPPSQRLELALFLRNNALPENRGYLYDHFTDNCATRPRDVIDLVTAGRLRAVAGDDGGASPAAGRMTLREHTRRHTARSPALSTLFDFVMNSDVDRPLLRFEESFLPAELAGLVADASDVDGAPLVVRAWSDHEAPDRSPVPERAPRLEPWLLAIGVVAGVVGVGLARSARSSRRRSAARADRLLAWWTAGLGLFLGGPGLALAVMWTSTDHLVAHDNENVLLANPLTLLAFPLGVAWALGSTRARRAQRWLWSALAVFALVGLALKALPGFDQNNWNILALVVPMVVGTATALSRARAPLPATAPAITALEVAPPADVVVVDAGVAAPQDPPVSAVPAGPAANSPPA